MNDLVDKNGLIAVNMKLLDLQEACFKKALTVALPQKVYWLNVQRILQKAETLIVNIQNQIKENE